MTRVTRKPSTPAKDAAFVSADDRLAFIHDVYQRLSERAKAISEQYVRAVLGVAEHNP